LCASFAVVSHIPAVRGESLNRYLLLALCQFLQRVRLLYRLPCLLFILSISVRNMHIITTFARCGLQEEHNTRLVGHFSVRKWVSFQWGLIFWQTRWTQDSKRTIFEEWLLAWTTI
jgi:hypothetical protein